MTIKLTFEKEYKEPKGKYLHLKLIVNDKCCIDDIVITGDFFAYPPENIDKLSLMLKGLTLLNIDDLMERVEDIIKNTEIIGINSRVFKELILGLLKEGLKECQRAKEKYI